MTPWKESFVGGEIYRSLISADPKMLSPRRRRYRDLIEKAMITDDIDSVSHCKAKPVVKHLKIRMSQVTKELEEIAQKTAETNAKSYLKDLSQSEEFFEAMMEQIDDTLRRIESKYDSFYSKTDALLKKLKGLQVIDKILSVLTRLTALESRVDEAIKKVDATNRKLEDYIRDIAELRSAAKHLKENVNFVDSHMYMW